MPGIVMSTDLQYAEYAMTAIISIRKYNNSIPIKLYLCDNIPYLTAAANHLSFATKCVPMPAYLDRIESEKLRQHIWTRIAKLTAIIESTFDWCLYLDADIIALDDVGKITAITCDQMNDSEIHMLLRRPHLPSVYEWRRPYIRDSLNLTPEDMATLVNQVFALNYPAEEILNITCWNGGVIYGTQKAIKLLGKLWLALYEKMVTGPYLRQMVPKDQLCLWLAAKQLERQITIQELPLEWNFMPGHTLLNEDLAHCDLAKLRRPIQERAKILHLCHRKSDNWASELIKSIRASAHL